MNKSMKIASIMIIMALLLGIGAACAGKPAGPETYKLGGNWEMTGWGGYYGTQSVDASNLYIKRVNEAGGINGKLIDYIIHDNETEAEVTATNVKKLIEKDQVVAMIGPIFNQNCVAAMEAAKGGYTPLLWNTTGQRPANNSESYDFVNFPREEGFAESVLRYLRDVHGVQRLAVLATTDESGEEDMGYALTVGAELGLEVVLVERVDPDAIDVTAQLTKIKAAKVDGLHLGGGGAVIGPMMKGIALLELDIPVSGPTGLTGGEMLALMKGFEPENLVLPAMPPMLVGLGLLSADHPLTTANMAFADAWVGEFGGDKAQILMEEWGWVGWDAAQWMVDAMIRAGARLDGTLQDGRDAIRYELEHTVGLEQTWGIRNTSPSDHNGIPTKEFYILTVKDGVFSLLQ